MPDVAGNLSRNYSPSMGRCRGRRINEPSSYCGTLTLMVSPKEFSGAVGNTLTSTVLMVFLFAALSAAVACGADSQWPTPDGTTTAKAGDKATRDATRAAQATVEARVALELTTRSAPPTPAPTGPPPTATPPPPVTPTRPPPPPTITPISTVIASPTPPAAPEPTANGRRRMARRQPRRETRLRRHKSGPTVADLELTLRAANPRSHRATAHSYPSRRHRRRLLSRRPPRPPLQSRQQLRRPHHRCRRPPGRMTRGAPMALAFHSRRTIPAW